MMPIDFSDSRKKPLLFESSHSCVVEESLLQETNVIKIN